MDLAIALGHRAQVEKFQRKYRIGLLTLLFADIVDSTRLKQELGDRAAFDHLERHHAALREILGHFEEAEEISTAGDSSFLVFTKPSDAVRFSLRFQARLRKLAEETGHPAYDRIGIHVGEVFITEEAGTKDLYGIQVDIAARVLALGEAQQILMTRFAFDSARQVLRGQDLEGLGTLCWMNHGPYRLKGMEEPLELCGVAEEGNGVVTPPASSDKAQRFEMPDAELVPGWRPAIDQIVPNTHWVLEKKLGEGGFGEVWLACHNKLHERRVIKFCFRADRVRSLKREVTLFRVMKEKFGHHPRIVGIQEVCFDSPPYYLVMDYARGQDLKGWCAERGGLKEIPRITLIEIAAQVADALQAAHEAGVIHRDIKPGNILVSGTGVSPADASVKLTDFGIGQVVSPEVLAGLTRSGFTQTVAASGQTGTHIYMAPELIANKPSSTRSDTFSLGVVLYQMLVGDFTQPLTVDWMQEIDDPLLREDLTRCFAGNPMHRWPRVAQLAENLRTLEQRRLEQPKEQPTAGVAPKEAPARESIAQIIPRRDPHLKATLVDLSRFYNAALDKDWYGEPGGNLAMLPHGRTAVFAGTEFDLRGLIQLSSQNLKADHPEFPERIRGIPLARKCRRLHFLHAALCLESDGTAIGSYLLHFTDGQKREAPILYGHDLREWCFDYDPVREIRGAVVAWTGRNAGQHPVRLYKCTWENPQPDTEMVSMDFVSTMTDAAPFLIALTSE
jgi:serine/threonine protein kinase/class 3 adenylate cyclase